MKKFLFAMFLALVLVGGILIGSGMVIAPVHAAEDPVIDSTVATIPTVEPTAKPTIPEETVPDVVVEVTDPVVEETVPVVTEPKVESQPAGCDHLWIREYQPETETECGYISRCCAKCGSFELLETIPPYGQEN